MIVKTIRKFDERMHFLLYPALNRCVSSKPITENRFAYRCRNHHSMERIYPLAKPNFQYEKRQKELEKKKKKEEKLKRKQEKNTEREDTGAELQPPDQDSTQATTS